MNLEKEVFKAVKAAVNNPRMKQTDLLEWSSDKATVTKNLRDDEVYVTVEALDMTWHCAVLKSADKRVKATKKGGK